VVLILLENQEAESSIENKNYWPEKLLDE